jgi:hypothetical protein
MNAITRVLGIALLVLVVACSDDPGTGPGVDPVVVRVQVTPGTAELAFGKSAQLQATAYTQEGAVQRPVVWSSSDPDVAHVDAQG